MSPRKVMKSSSPRRNEMRRSSSLILRTGMRFFRAGARAAIDLVAMTPPSAGAVRRCSRAGRLQRLISTATRFGSEVPPREDDAFVAIILRLREFGTRGDQPSRARRKRRARADHQQLERPGVVSDQLKGRAVAAAAEAIDVIFAVFTL